MRKHDYLISGAGIDQLVIYGVLLHSGMRSLYQDIIGKDAYLQVTAAGWISAKYTVPLALLLIVSVFVAINNLMKEGREDLTAVLDEACFEDDDEEDDTPNSTRTR